jgi:hypothetical protein
MTFEKGIELLILFITLIGGVYGVIRVTVVRDLASFKDAINQRFDTLENNYNQRICNLEDQGRMHTEKIFSLGEKVAKMEGRNGEIN